MDARMRECKSEWEKRFAVTKEAGLAGVLGFIQSLVPDLQEKERR